MFLYLGLLCPWPGSAVLWGGKELNACLLSCDVTTFRKAKKPTGREKL